MLPGLMAFGDLKYVPITVYYCSLKKKQTLEAVKLWHLLFLFTQIYRVWLIKSKFRTITWRTSCYNFKTILKSWEIWKLMLLNVSIVHIQLHIYGFSRTVNLFCSSQNMETYLGGEELRFESRFIMFRQNSSNLHVRKLKWHGCINKYFFYISFPFVNTIGQV